jgi:hypothetical protein
MAAVNASRLIVSGKMALISAALNEVREFRRLHALLMCLHSSTRAGNSGSPRFVLSHRIRGCVIDARLHY